MAQAPQSSHAPNSNMDDGFFGPLIKEAVTSMLHETGITLSPELEAKMIHKVKGVAEKKIDSLSTAAADAIIQGSKAPLSTELNNIKNDVRTGAQESIDHVSRAAAATVMPELNKIVPPELGEAANSIAGRPVWPIPTPTSPAPSTPSNNKPVSSQFLAGMSEGEGEEVTTPSSAASEQPPMTGPVPPLDSGTTPDSDAQQAVKPGQENIPQWDLSPKQKAAYAQQQLGNQLQAEPGPGQTATPDTTQQTPATTTSQPTTIDELEQDLANQLQNVRGKSVRQKNESDRQNHRRHQSHNYRELLAQDKAVRQHQSGGAEDPHQSISRRLAYAVGLKAVDKFAEHLGEHVKENIKTGQFKNFLIALLLSMARDLPKGVLTMIGWAVGDPGVIATMIGSILNLMISALLAVVLFGEGTWFKRYLIKRFFGKMIIAFIAGFIPGFAYFPFYTVSIIIMKLQNDAAMRRQKKALAAIQEQIKELRKLQRRGKNVNPRKIAKIKAKLEELKKVADE